MTVAIERAGTVETVAVVEQLRDMQLDEFFASECVTRSRGGATPCNEKSRWCNAL